MSVWWSVGLSAMSLLASWLIGNKQRVGWLVGVALQVPWAVYSITTEQWGFLASCCVYTVVNVRNWLRWRREARETRTREEVTV